MNNQIAKKRKNAERMREYRKLNPIIFQRIDLKKNYGMSLEDYNKLKTIQNNLCAICLMPEKCLKSPTSSIPRNLAVDHCHKTGKIRGLLCTACNRVIGLLKDDAEILKSAITYLESRA